MLFAGQTELPGGIDAKGEGTDYGGEAGGRAEQHPTT